MDVDQEKLAALYRAGTQPRDRSACPGSEEMALATQGKPEAPARARLAAHLTVCSACADEYRLATALEPWAGRAAGALRPGVRAGSFGKRSRFAVSLLAAAAAFVIALGIALFRGGGANPSPATTVRGARPATWTFVTPIDGATVTGAPSRLSWAGVDGAAGYEIALFDAESTLVWQSERLATNSVELPGDVRAKLAAPGIFLWRVTAFRAGERVLSPLMRFEVRP